jgi:hypothetical protein
MPNFPFHNEVEPDTCQMCNEKRDHLCGNKPHYVDGVNLAGARVCQICMAKYNNRIYYCPHNDCQKYYKATIAWFSEAGMSGCAFVPCKKHSLDADRPVVDCAVDYCEMETYVYDCRWTSRGLSLCGDHAHEGKRCGARFCRSVVHPDMTHDVINKGSKSYCIECYDIRVVPEAAPENYHPYHWDYNTECLCIACSYLRGKGHKWLESHDSALGPTVHCTVCMQEVSMTNTHINDDGTPWCHMCAKGETRTCYKCGELKLHREFHVAHPADSVSHDYEYQYSCDTCMKNLKTYWFCTIQCNEWYKIGKECPCGGVYEWKYTADPLIFTVAESQSSIVVKDTPFLGLELEIEAKKHGSSRALGAKLVKQLAGDYSYCVHDGTLAGNKHDGTGGDFGFEIVTHPFTMEWFEEQWPRIEELLLALSSQGYRSWDGGRCGIHVHISRAPMSDMHQMKFIRFIYGSTNLSMCIGQRGYRDANLKKYAPFDGEHRASFIRKIRNFDNPGVQGHYSALNANKPATLEGRWFRGTLKPSGVRKNVEYMHSVWHFTKLYGFNSANEMNYITWLREPRQSRYRILTDYIERQYITRR